MNDSDISMQMLLRKLFSVQYIKGMIKIYEEDNSIDFSV